AAWPAAPAATYPAASRSSPGGCQRRCMCTSPGDGNQTLRMGSRRCGDDYQPIRSLLAVVRKKLIAALCQGDIERGQCDRCGGTGDPLLKRVQVGVVKIT